jgi:hypothetical protein
VLLERPEKEPKRIFEDIIGTFKRLKILPTNQGFTCIGMCRKQIILRPCGLIFRRSPPWEGEPDPSVCYFLPLKAKIKLIFKLSLKKQQVKVISGKYESRVKKKHLTNYIRQNPAA